MSSEPQANPGPPPHNASAPRTEAGGAWLRHVVAGLLLAATLAGLIGLWLHSHWQVTTDNAYVVGNVTPISSEVSGTVVVLYTDDNMLVQAGEPLAQIDPVPFQFQVDQAQADLRQARADAEAADVNVRRIEEDRRALLGESTAKRGEAEQSLAAAIVEVQTRERVHQQEQELLNSLKSRLPGLEALTRNAQEYFERFTRLAATGDIPVQDRDNREAAYRDAYSKLDALRNEVAASERRVLASQSQLRESGVRVEQSRRSVESAQATVRRAEAAQREPAIARANLQAARDRVELAAAKLRLAQLALSNCLIRAPRTGIVSRRTIQLGQTVTARQPFLSIVPLDLENVWVVANLREDQMARVRVGMSAKVTVDAIPGHVFDGWVESVSGGTGSVFSVFPPDNATGNFTRVVQRLPVRIRFDRTENYENRIRPGLSARVWIDDTRYVRHGGAAW